MRRKFHPIAIGILLIVASLRTTTATAQQPQSTTDDPPAYHVQFQHDLPDLIGDLLKTERGDPLRQAAIPSSEWYSATVRRRMGSWGPIARRYPPIPGLEHRSVDWCRERTVAVGLRYLGRDYQHHHVPDWNPPAGWPWKPVSSGTNGRGVDCSNFTGFVFNQGFGIRISTDVEKQSEQRTAETDLDRPWPIRRIELPEHYPDRLRTLKTGDLLYISGRPGGPITHVVIWVGSIGRSPDDTPLVLDSHGSGVVDAHGRSIPAGVQLRPFREHSWYNRSASHAHRIFHTPSS